MELGRAPHQVSMLGGKKRAFLRIMCNALMSPCTRSASIFVNCWLSCCTITAKSSVSGMTIVAVLTKFR